MLRIELEKVVKFNEFLVTPFFLVSRSLSQNIYLPTPIDVRKLSTMASKAMVPGGRTERKKWL